LRKAGFSKQVKDLKSLKQFFNSQINNSVLSFNNQQFLKYLLHNPALIRIDPWLLIGFTDIAVALLRLFPFILALGMIGMIGSLGVFCPPDLRFLYLSRRQRFLRPGSEYRGFGLALKLPLDLDLRRRCLPYPFRRLLYIRYPYDPLLNGGTRLRS
jgi:hypothetical protein